MDSLRTLDCSNYDESKWSHCGIPVSCDNRNNAIFRSCNVGSTQHTGLAVSSYTVSDDTFA